LSGMAPELRAAIRELVRLATTQHMAHPADRARLGAVEELVTTALRALGDDIDLGQVKLMRRALREMRASFTLFNHHRTTRKVAVFGSARTPPGHPDYVAAHVFTRTLADRGWMAITGAGPGIMQAGIEGPSPEQAFGLAIRLPYEQKPVEAILNDPKLLEFRHFFTRKLAFMGSADAVAAFPGGYGTQDELFEALTLVQCGRNAVIPIVLVEGTGPDGQPLGYWPRWESFIREAVFASGWVDAEELGLYRIASSPAEAADIVSGFYRRYRSSRWVGEHFVIRLDAPLPGHAAHELASEFGDLLAGGTIEQGTQLDGDDAPVGTPRIWFRHDRRRFGLLRRMIDRINALPHVAMLVAATLVATLAVGCAAPQEVTGRPDGIPGDAAPAPEPAPDMPSMRVTLPVDRGDIDGLVTLSWQVPENDSVLRTWFASHAPDRTDAAEAARLAAQGWAVAQVPLDALPDALVALGGSFGQARTWHGQALEWREIARARVEGGAAVLMGPRPVRLADGTISLMLRGWTVPLELGAVYDVELAPMQRTPPGPGAATRERVQWFADASMALELPKGTATLITGLAPRAERAGDASASQGSRRTASGRTGPFTASAPTVGELLLVPMADRDAALPRRTVIVLVPLIASSHIDPDMDAVVPSASDAPLGAPSAKAP
jgi:uncharacterized protein (TIGR00730 family)